MRSNPPSRPLVVAALLSAVLGGVAVHAETRDFSCIPSAVKVDEQKIEIVCAEPILLSDRSQDRFREVDRFAYPMVSRNFQPLLGSQVKLLDYFLDVAQSAVIHERQLHIWFETDYAVSADFGCDPVNCRQLTALALTRERANPVSGDTP